MGGEADVSDMKYMVFNACWAVSRSQEDVDCKLESAKMERLVNNRVKVSYNLQPQMFADS